MRAQTRKKQCFPAALTTEHFTENKPLRMLTSQHCFLGAQTEIKQNFSAKRSEALFLSRKQKVFPQQMFHVHANGEKLRTTCFRKVSSFAGAKITPCKSAFNKVELNYDSGRIKGEKAWGKTEGIIIKDLTLKRLRLK